MSKALVGGAFTMALCLLRARAGRLARPPPSTLSSLSSLSAASAARPVSSQSRPLSPPRRPQVLVISGPTAVGKSALATTLCEQHVAAQAARSGGGVGGGGVGGEIISADSVQVYKSLDIGSNKPSLAERARVPYHLVDTHEPATDNCTAGDFVRAAWAAAADVAARGRLPVVAGGTMMYLRWFVEGAPDAPRSDPAVCARVRAALEPLREAGDWEGGLARLAAEDPARAARLNRNDWYRLQRALEIAAASAAEKSVATTTTAEAEAEVAGAAAASSAVAAAAAEEEEEEEEEDALANAARASFDLRCFFLVRDRLALNRAIDARCEAMVRRGLLRETAGLLAAGRLGPDCVAGRSIGYRQAMEYLTKLGELNARGGGDSGDSGAAAAAGPVAAAAAAAAAAAVVVVPPSHEEKVAAFSSFMVDFCGASRRYAKRQMTWYRGDRAFAWVAVDGAEGRAGAEAAVTAALALSEEGFAALLRSEEQQQLREANKAGGARLKTYVTALELMQPGQESDLREVLRVADECAAQVVEAAAGGGGGGGNQAFY